MSSPLEVAWPPKLDYSRQAVEVPGTRRPGQTGTLGSNSREVSIH